jgi:A/G-specific adenine glycosylase
VLVGPPATVCVRFGAWVAITDWTHAVSRAYDSDTRGACDRAQFPGAARLAWRWRTARHPVSSAPTSRWLRRQVLYWAQTHGRDFAWRRSKAPYDVLLAELLLHRTRADVVEPTFLQLRAAYPTPERLAEADENELAELLRPLGYTHRSRRLPSLGRALVERHRGGVPSHREELLGLPGVGRYIANAVLAMAFNKPVPLLDPNVIRVIGRVFNVWSEKPRPRDDHLLWDFLERLVPAGRPADFGLALVDLGALICRPRRPRCGDCPLRMRCVAYTSGTVDPAA